MDSTVPLTPLPQPVTCQRKDCLATVLALSTQAATDERARVGGWRVWDGPTLGGSVARAAICPEHARVPRPRKPDVQEYDQPLF
jgi:hypothetical protein